MTKQSSYWVTCDSCGKLSEDYDSRRVADTYAKWEGWIVNNYRDVCPSCQEKNK